MASTGVTLFEKYGGFSTISRMVHEFYEHVLESDQLAPYFEASNMDQLIEHQTRFISHLMGGPVTYEGRDLATAHQFLNITEAAFNEVAAILSDILEDGGVNEEDLNIIMNTVASVKKDIVKHTAKSS